MEKNVKYAHVRILTEGVIPSMGSEGPVSGLLTMDVINMVIRSDKKPVKFMQEDGNGFTLALVEKDPKSALMRAYANNKHQIDGIIEALSLEGYDLLETGYIKPKKAIEIDKPEGKEKGEDESITNHKSDEIKVEEPKTDLNTGTVTPSPEKITKNQNRKTNK